jgi:hypothetical protein
MHGMLCDGSFCDGLVRDWDVLYVNRKINDPAEFENHILGLSIHSCTRVEGGGGGGVTVDRSRINILFAFFRDSTSDHIFKLFERHSL